MKIDSFGSKKPIRHVVAEKLERGWIRTNCNRQMINYWEANNTSYFYMDKSRYAWPCRTCLPEEYAALATPAAS